MRVELYFIRLTAVGIRVGGYFYTFHTQFDRLVGRIELMDSVCGFVPYGIIESGFFPVFFSACMPLSVRTGLFCGIFPFLLPIFRTRRIFHFWRGATEKGIHGCAIPSE